MKRKNGFILMLVVMFMMAASTVMAQSEKPSYLFALGAKSGSFEGETLTLNGVPNVIYFSDRPNRLFGHITLEEFAEHWGEGPNNFKDDPPNADLSLSAEIWNQNVVVELRNFQLEGNTVIFNVRVLEGDVPTSFMQASLFIDSESPAQSMGSVYQTMSDSPGIMP